MQMRSVQYFTVERAEINKRIVLYSDVQFYSLGKYESRGKELDLNRRFGKMAARLYERVL